MKKIELSGRLGKNKFALVSNQDFDRVKSYNWYISKYGYYSTSDYYIPDHNYQDLCDYALPKDIVKS